MAHIDGFHGVPPALPGTPTEWLRAERARRPGVLPTRGVGATLLRIIREQPGIHFRALGRQAGLTSSGQLRHHLDRLADLGAIAEVKDGRFSRFFSGGEEDPRLRLRQARFSRPVPNLIARLLADRPMSRTELRRRLGCADSTLGYHLNRLLVVGDLQRRIGPNGHEYALTDSGLVAPEIPWRHFAPTAPTATAVATASATNSFNGALNVNAAPTSNPTPFANAPSSAPWLPSPSASPAPAPTQQPSPAPAPAPAPAPMAAPPLPAASPGAPAAPASSDAVAVSQ